MDVLRQRFPGDGDFAIVAGNLARRQRVSLAVPQNRFSGLQRADANFYPLQILQDGHWLSEFRGGAANQTDAFRVIRIFAMGKIQPGDAHSRAHHRQENVRVCGRRGRSWRRSAPV